MKPKTKKYVRRKLKEKFGSAYVAYPRNGKKMNEFLAKIDAVKQRWPGITDKDAERIVINETMKNLI